MSFSLRQFQIEETAMLEAVADCLQKNNIPFYLLGGSCIGALRHSGFVPWDDDIDIAIMRSDFEAAEKALATLDSSLLYDPIENHILADAPVGHVYKTNMPLDESPRIDVFAIDAVPRGSLARKYQKICANVYHLCILRCPSKNRGEFNRLFTTFICKAFPGWLLDRLQKLAYKGITRWEGKGTGYVSNLFGLRGVKEIVPADYYGTPRFVPFEGLMMPIPEKAEEYMNHVYGDYMKLPPENERTPEHFVALLTDEMAEK